MVLGVNVNMMNDDRSARGMNLFAKNSQFIIGVCVILACVFAASIVAFIYMCGSAEP